MSFPTALLVVVLVGGVGSVGGWGGVVVVGMFFDLENFCRPSSHNFTSPKRGFQSFVLNCLHCCILGILGCVSHRLLGQTPCNIYYVLYSIFNYSGSGQCPFDYFVHFGASNIFPVFVPVAGARLKHVDNDNRTVDNDTQLNKHEPTHQ